DATVSRALGTCICGDATRKPCTAHAAVLPVTNCHMVSETPALVPDRRMRTSCGILDETPSAAANHPKTSITPASLSLAVKREQSGPASALVGEDHHVAMDDRTLAGVA